MPPRKLSPPGAAPTHYACSTTWMFENADVVARCPLAPFETSGTCSVGPWNRLVERERGSFRDPWEGPITQRASCETRYMAGEPSGTSQVTTAPAASPG